MNSACLHLLAASDLLPFSLSSSIFSHLWSLSSYVTCLSMNDLSALHWFTRASPLFRYTQPFCALVLVRYSFGDRLRPFSCRCGSFEIDARCVLRLPGRGGR